MSAVFAAAIWTTLAKTPVCCDDPIRVECGCGDCDAGAAGDMCGNCGELWLTE